MTTLTLLLTLFAIDSLSILSPGPSILLVTRAAVEQGRRQALWVACGLAAAGLVWAGIAVTGLAALFELLPMLQTAIRVAGAAYLLWLGVRLLRSRGDMAAEAPAPSVHASRAAFLRGVATSLLNPKVLAYFGSIFVLLVPADASHALRAGAVLLVGFDALLWYSLAALLLSMPAVARGYRALRRPIDRACGALLVVFGLRLVADS
jgi:threonine efflux protein